MSVVSSFLDICVLSANSFGNFGSTSSSRVLSQDVDFPNSHSQFVSKQTSLEITTNESLCLPTNETSFELVNKRIWTTSGSNKTFFTEEKWDSFNFEEMYSYFNCYEHAMDPNKKLYNPRMWEALRTGFDQQLFSDESLYYSGYSEGKGRGTFAKRDIRKGEIVHDGLQNVVFFPDGASWGDFIFSIPSSRMACDVLEWTWMQDVIFEGNLMLCLNLDDAAFLNDGGEEESNIAPISETSLLFYATRDIEKDEELLYDYGLYDTNWEEFDL
mmetsp:Transcript_19136/g.39213  ORF Transcript_19136/g.39213 Transcript_19136/m.39213 type:complete len:271 (-) Transcript_19136:130-942(-)|eukprot:CAMPEP_0171403464 /NCGR_PEP_ID=MMETSP0880-20121228/11167_1 /TAXON_ID=67004 /ORGANISM="Thalassiosira weissflogii, Strain CCMP1336" /LENGTH=270 /DNA_ID=CAMNT_0011918409 /DNA_START=100 /DNA_END=912 /DNA_ORIENTATION=+